MKNKDKNFFYGQLCLFQQALHLKTHPNPKSIRVGFMAEPIRKM
jgi:hypothetical protein